MKELLFIYNAESAFSYKTFDFFHKIISPQTYSCDLCKITHGLITERSKWKTFRKNSNLKMVFLYRDEFEKTYGQKFEYPAVLVKPNFDILLSKSEIKKISNVDELISKIEIKTNQE